LDGDTVYTTIRQFLNHWECVRIVTLQVLRLFTDDELRYRFTPEWRTVGEIFHHIGAHQYYVARGVFKKRWNPESNEPDTDWEHHKIVTLISVERIAKWLLSIQFLLKEWCNESDSSVLSSIRFDNPWHQGAEGWMLLHHAYQDELHHRGQLTAIARHLGKKIPPVFAESTISNLCFYIYGTDENENNE
jgi:uncharacterized damage-inducible protein DinB